MKVYGSTLVQGPQSMVGPHRAGSNPSAADSSPLSEVDQLDISPAGDLASRSLDGAALSDRVSQIRAAIAAGAYETDEKLSVALDRLLDEIG